MVCCVRGRPPRSRLVTESDDAELAMLPQPLIIIPPPASSSSTARPPHSQPTPITHIIRASKRFLSAAYEIKICPPFSYQMLATKRWHCGSMRHKLVYRTTGRPITNSCQSFSPEEWFLFAQSAGRRAALSPLFLAHQSSFCVTVHLILEGKTKPSYR